MKKLLYYLFVFALLLTFSCKKYENGPHFSLLTKKERISNKWQFELYKEDGVDKTTYFNNLYQNAILNIETDGDYSFTYKLGGIEDYSETGSWKFVNNKDDFETYPQKGIGFSGTHNILRLKDTQLWYYDEENGVRKEYHLKR